MEQKSNGVAEKFSEELRTKLDQSQSVLKQALDKYHPNQIFLSFNGGKDCTVLLHILSELIAGSSGQLKVFYFRSADPFTEIEDFVVSCERFYKIQISTIQADSSMKDVLTKICESDPEISACIMGSRRTDPYCSGLNSFQPTDRGWPTLMRINPMLDWNCANVWEYLLKKKVPYCSLYDVGYTSIGNIKNTRPNPNLEVEGKPGSYRPAYKLLDDSLERAGRITAEK